MAFRSFDHGLLDRLRDPEYAAAYLNAALEGGRYPEFLRALRDVQRARAGTVGRAAQRLGVNRESIYRAFCHAGNPRLSTLRHALDVAGLKIVVAPKARTTSQ